MWCRAARCILTQLVVTTMVLIYSIYGGYLVMYLELDTAGNTRTHVQKARKNLMEALWEITRSTKSLEDHLQWAKDTERLVDHFQQTVYIETSEHGWDGKSVGATKTKWTLPASVLYCLTLITTIGYGNYTPKTRGGMLFTIVYSIIGIPLFLIFLANVGSVLAMAFRALFARTYEKYEHARTGTGREYFSVPWWISLQIISVWIALGALVFSHLEENWSFLEAAYFSFVTLSTIGLGDYVPGTSFGDESSGALIFTCVYVLVGMALLVTTFELIQEEVLRKIRYLSALLRCSQGIEPLDPEEED